MMDIKDISAQYAAENTNKFLSQLIAQAFADGYRKGYKDKEEEIPIDLRDGMTEYIDLGLPSGTLWSSEYEEIDGRELYLPYNQVIDKSIPTTEQWKELLEICKWESDRSSGGSVFYGAYCIGPNGNSIKFKARGARLEKTVSMHHTVLFWLIDNDDKNYQENISIEKKAACIESYDRCVKNLYGGYKLPIRLVKTK